MNMANEHDGQSDSFVYFVSTVGLVSIHLTTMATATHVIYKMWAIAGYFEPLSAELVDAPNVDGG